MGTLELKKVLTPCASDPLGSAEASSLHSNKQSIVLSLFARPRLQRGGRGGFLSLLSCRRSANVNYLTLTVQSSELKNCKIQFYPAVVCRC